MHAQRIYAPFAVNIFASGILVEKMAHVIVCVCQAGNLVVDFIWSEKRYMPIFHRIVNVLGPVPGMYGPSGDEEYCGDSPDAFDC